MKTTTSPRILPGWCATRDAFRTLYPYLERRALAAATVQVARALERWAAR